MFGRSFIKNDITYMNLTFVYQNPIILNLLKIVTLKFPMQALNIFLPICQDVWCDRNLVGHMCNTKFLKSTIQTQNYFFEKNCFPNKMISKSQVNRRNICAGKNALFLKSIIKFYTEISEIICTIFMKENWSIRTGKYNTVNEKVKIFSCNMI